MKRVFRFSLKTHFLCHNTKRNSGHPKPVFLSIRLFLGKIWYKEKIEALAMRKNLIQSVAPSGHEPC